MGSALKSKFFPMFQKSIPYKIRPKQFFTPFNRRSPKPILVISTVLSPTTTTLRKKENQTKNVYRQCKISKTLSLPIKASIYSYHPNKRLAANFFKKKKFYPLLILRPHSQCPRCLSGTDIL